MPDDDSLRERVRSIVSEESVAREKRVAKGWLPLLPPYPRMHSGASVASSLALISEHRRRFRVASEERSPGYPAKEENDARRRRHRLGWVRGEGGGHRKFCNRESRAAYLDL